MLDESTPLPLTAIRAFEAAARRGSFARAAEELGMTAAAVSYQVRQLESRLGVTLFVRHARHVELTPAAALIAPAVSDSFRALRAALTRAVERSEAELTISTLPTVGASWLAPKLGRFHAAHPGTRVKLELAVETVDFTSGAVDAAVRSGLGEWPGLKAHELLPNVYGPVCSPELRETARQLERPDQPLGVPLLGRPAWWSAWYAALGWPGVDLAGRFGTEFGAEHIDVTAAIAGHGIAMVSPIFFQRELAAGAIVPAHDLLVMDGRRYWLAYPGVRARSPKLQAFRRWLEDEAAADVERHRERLASAVRI